MPSLLKATAHAQTESGASVNHTKSFKATVLVQTEGRASLNNTYSFKRNYTGAEGRRSLCQPLLVFQKQLSTHGQKAEPLSTTPSN